MNKIILTGNITHDIEISKTPAGLAVVKFSIANTEFNGKEKETHFFNLVAFRATAETISKFCRKGDKIIISGKLQVKDYEKDGVKKTYTTIIVDNFEFCQNPKQAAEKPKQTINMDEFVAF